MEERASSVNDGFRVERFCGHYKLRNVQAHDGCYDYIWSSSLLPCGAESPLRLSAEHWLRSPEHRKHGEANVYFEIPSCREYAATILALKRHADDYAFDQGLFLEFKDSFARTFEKPVVTSTLINYCCGHHHCFRDRAGIDASIGYGAEAGEILSRDDRITHGYRQRHTCVVDEIIRGWSRCQGRGCASSGTIRLA